MDKLMKMKAELEERENKGFTLMEMLIVVAIIAVLGGIGLLFAFKAWRDRLPKTLIPAEGESEGESDGEGENGVTIAELK